MNEAQLQEAYQRALAERDDGTRGSCVSLDALHVLARGAGSESQRLETLSHVMSCRACQHELDLLRAIEGAGERTGGSSTAARRATRALSWRSIVPLALAASLLIAVGIGVGDRFGGGEGDVTRGEAGALAPIAPIEAAEVAAGGPIDFTWHPAPDARRYILEVLTPGGDVVLSRETSDTVVTVADTDALAPGADYQWWVRAVTAGGQRTSAVRRLRVRSQ